jgi:glycosyltransferase involved in cell wall biosynthesis
MNILFLAPFFPYPLSQGGKIVIFNMIKYLSRTNRITLACLSDTEIAEHGPLGDYCEEILVVRRSPRPARDLAAFLASGEPFNAVRYASRRFREAIRRLLDRKSFDLVQIEFPLLWTYADLFPGIPVVLNVHNIEHRIIRQIGDGTGNPLKRTLYRLEERKLRRLEEKAWRECDLCFTVSDEERNTIGRYLGEPGKVQRIIGIDLERFAWSPKAEAGKQLLFIGGMDYQPNLDSALYFLAEILPRIRARDPDVRIDIVGRELDRIPGRENFEGAAFHENVPEILPFFRKADLLVVPLRSGAGIRIKILEAMSAGLPVVTTSKGCEGIGVRDREHVLVGDSPETIAAAVSRLLGDDELRKSLARNGRRLIEERYSWEFLAKEMVECYRRLLYADSSVSRNPSSEK